MSILKAITENETLIDCWLKLILPINSDSGEPETLEALIETAMVLPEGKQMIAVGKICPHGNRDSFDLEPQNFLFLIDMEEGRIRSAMTTGENGPEWIECDFVSLTPDETEDTEDSK